MPRILTEPYKNATFFVPWTPDKSQGFWAIPITRTVRGKLWNEAILEAGTDMDIATALFKLRLLQDAVRGWRGVVDAAGKEVEFSRDALKSLWELNPSIADDMAEKVLAVATIGERDDLKN